MSKAENSPSLPFAPIPANPEQHLLAIARLTSDIFAMGEFIDEISQTYIGNCHYDFDTTRLIFVDEELVHHWGV